MRWRTRLLTVALLAGCLVAGTGLVAVAAPVPADRSAGDTAPPDPDQVIVVGVAGLRWSDVDPVDTPVLTELVRTGSVGSVSVRSAEQVTCPADGWLTLGAGAYATAGESGRDDCRDRPPPTPPPAGPVVPTMPDLRGVNNRPRQTARVGLLGEELRCTTAVGPGAALAAATPDGQVRHYRSAPPADATDLLARCPFTAADLGPVSGTGADRRDSLRSLDRSLEHFRTQRPPGSVLMVFGLSEAVGDQPRLHLGVAAGPGFGPGWLWSPSTRRPPYVRLVDVAPTVLEVLGRDVPDVLPGRPLAGGAAGRPAALDAALDRLVDTDTRAVAQDSVLAPFFGLLGVLLLAVLGVVAWLARRRTRWRVTAGVASGVALVLSAVPAASFLANLVPWWRTPAPALAVTAAVAVASAAVVGPALLVGAVHRRRGSPCAGTGTEATLATVAVLTVAVLTVDALTGARLQLDSLLGYNPLVGGRFVGFGNLAFSVYAAAAVLLAALAAHGRPARVAWLRIGLVAVPVTVVTGMPGWGANFGGVLALVPTFAVLGQLITRARITWWRAALPVVGGAVVVLLISWLDHLRPAGSRSHFGRFFDSLSDGAAVATIRRKLLANLELLVMGPHTIAAALLTLLGVVLVFRPPPALRRVHQTWPVTRPALVGVVVLAAFGFAFNDSGIAIPVVVSLVVLPTVLALSARIAAGPTAADGGDHDRPGRSRLPRPRLPLSDRSVPPVPARTAASDRPGCPPAPVDAGRHRPASQPGADDLRR